MTTLEFIHKMVDERIKHLEVAAKESTDTKAPRTPEEWAFVREIIEINMVIEAGKCAQKERDRREKTNAGRN